MSEIESEGKNKSIKYLLTHRDGKNSVIEKPQVQAHDSCFVFGAAKGQRVRYVDVLKLHACAKIFRSWPIGGLHEDENCAEDVNAYTYLKVFDVSRTLMTSWLGTLNLLQIE